MSIKIYTYTNPYTIEEEEFWDDIRNCPHFCASQTLVNGMKSVCQSFKNNFNITTIRNLINVLYEKWDDVGTKVKQMVEVDNAIKKIVIDGNFSENTKKALYNNVKSIASCIRIFAELNLNPDNFKMDNINIDQKYLVDIYKVIYRNSMSSFKLVRINNETTINNAIEKSLINTVSAEKKADINFSKLDFRTVVISGIHQFTPAILCAIEDLAKFKNVILIFNYQKQYQKIYQTWLDIYSTFNINIKFSSNSEFVPNALMGEANQPTMLADSIGKMCECTYNEKNEELDSMEIIEFENNTEFANYVAQIYDKALRQQKIINNPKSSTLKFMDEQFYSASSRINDILRAYFPEQFEQRHFLDYPIGHFFIATMNMWDSENNTVVVNSFSDLKECLTSGILTETKKGLLINTFNKILPYIEDLKDYDQILGKLSELKKNLVVAFEEKKRLGYFNVLKSDLVELINALRELKNIIVSFYNDFKDGNDNFKNFYARVKNFIMSKVDKNDDFDKKIVEVMHNLIDRMSETDIPNSGSFITLKQTLSYYLSQDENINHGAKWIVRGFEQIDGDILLSDEDKNTSTYHFCCLSDKDIAASKDEHLPWPLDVSFFNFIQIPLDWKYQVFLKSKTEYHNFNRYALLYGLEFCRNKCKLSYVKNENEKTNDLYYILSMLGMKIRKYNAYDKAGYLQNMKYPNCNDINIKNYVNSIDDIAKIKISICPYKYIMEQIVQDHAIFRDRFLIHTYMKILIKNNVLIELQGKPLNEKEIREIISEKYSKFNNKFRICTTLEEVQLKAQVYKNINNSYNIKNNVFKSLKVEDIKRIKKDEELLSYSAEKNLELLNQEEMEKIIEINDLVYKPSAYCKYCASKDICLEFKN